jgi:crossover junction endodeoxyribonuclease RuvC
MIYIGIDPGCSGAIAAITGRGNIVEVLRFCEASTEGCIAQMIGDFLERLHSDDICITIERVHSMPKQGVSTTFTFGRAYGESIGAAVLQGCPVQFITPQKWQRDLSLLSQKGEAKVAHKRRMQQHAALRWGQRVLRDEADALLLAEWARLKGDQAGRLIDILSED